MLEESKIASLFEGLNPQQKMAVLHTEGPTLVVAGAGSGKTSVLTRRIAYLMIEKQVPPWNILAITFTNKAAKEMSERIVKFVGEQASDLWMSTFHSLCVKLLRREGDRLGFQSNFSILDSDEQQTLIQQCMLDLNLDFKKFDPKSIQFRISGAKNTLVSANNSAAYFGGKVTDMACADVYRLYQSRLKQLNAMDFDDLLGHTVQMFHDHPDLLEGYQEKFQYIHVDEYQDTNYAQYQLVKMLSNKHKNLMVVGDGDQSIYRWRGADVTNILNFEQDYPSAKVILLEQNYRSTNTILQAANAVVRKNSRRKDKALWSDKGNGEAVHVYSGLDPEDEAAYVIRQIQEHIQSSGSYQDCAVLYRANVQSRVIEEALMAAAIPYRMIGGLTFYDRREIKDAFAYLRVLVNPRDEISLLRIINNPRRAIGDSTVKKLLDAAHEQDVTLFQIMDKCDEIGLSAASVKAVRQFYEMMMGLHFAQFEGYTVTEYVSEVLHRTGYRDQYTFSNKEEHQSRLQNLDELLRVTRSFDRRKRGTVEAFLAEVSILSSLDREDDEVQDAVTLMTLHASKGLEFPVVFLIGVEEGILPHQRSIDTEQGVEEERNLMYVGMTRAMEKLYISYCTERTSTSQVEINGPSRFIGEIPEELVIKGEFTYEIDDSWAPGDLLIHRTWGQGVIVDKSGSGTDTILHVMFHPRIGNKDVPIRFAKRP